jgi:Ca2+-binding EF-hand superfamily protein
MDLGNAIRWMGYPQTVEQLNDAIEEFDLDATGTVSLSEFQKIMRQYKETEVKRVRDKFKERDADDSGRLSMHELKQVLLHLGYVPTMEELKAMFTDLAGDQEEVGLWELETLVTGYRLEARERFRKCNGFTDREVEKFRKAFHKHDPQGDGYIDNKDLAKMLTTLFPKAQEDSKAHEKVRQTLKEIDETDGDGKLDFDEYLKLMRLLQDEEDMAKYNRERGAVASSGFSRTEVSEFRSIFQSFDSDSSGVMTFDEFGGLLEAIFPVNVVHGAKMTKELHVVFNDVMGIDEYGESLPVDFPGFLLIMKRLQDEDFGGINEQVAASQAAQS